MSEFRAADGRVPGVRGLATRRKLLAATVELIDSHGYRNVKVVDIARHAGTSPATFYQYFPDVQSAVLVSCAETTEAGAQHFAELADQLASSSAEPAAVIRELATSVISFWNEHRSLLRVMDLSALEGDERFRDLRIWMMNGVTTALQERAAAAGMDARQTKAVAAVVVSMMSHVAAYHPGLLDWGVRTEDLTSVMATMVDAALVS